MAEGRLLRKLIKAGATLPSDDFRRAAEEVIREERAKKHHLLASDLERILYGAATPETAHRVVREVPRDRERGLALIEVREPVRSLRDLVLADTTLSVLERTLLEQQRADVLGTYGLRPIARLLFAGPPGCGKTTAAEALATELSVELVVVRVDAVISSYLGETAANLGKVFDFLSRGRFVALFDEFDALGKERDDPSEHGELRRVVNAFLQMMDAYRGRSLLVAATNHERLLDRALWRRFDEVLVFEKPTLEQLRQLFAVKLRPVRFELPIEDRAFLARFSGMSHADVERVIVRSIKAMALKGSEFLTLDLVEDARKYEEQRMHLLQQHR
jgi:SpoVK/Ycf46/Vps4 family AAA+-type ATPase